MTKQKLTLVSVVIFTSVMLFGCVTDEGRRVGGSVAEKRPNTASSAISNVPDADTLFWWSIIESKNPADIQAYLAQFPHGKFAYLARNRLKTGHSQKKSAFSVLSLDGMWKIKFNFHPASDCYKDKFHDMSITNGRIKGVAYYSGTTFSIGGNIDSEGTTSAMATGRTAVVNFSGNFDNEKGSGVANVLGEVACSAGTWEAIRAASN